MMKKRILSMLLAVTAVLGLMSGCGSETASSKGSSVAEAAPVEESENQVGAADIGSALELGAEAAQSAVEEAAATNDPSLELYSYESSYNMGALTTGLPLTEDGETFSLWLSVPPNVGTLF